MSDKDEIRVWNHIGEAKSVEIHTDAPIISGPAQVHISFGVINKDGYMPDIPSDE